MGQSGARRRDRVLLSVLALVFVAGLAAACGGGAPSRALPIAISTPQATPTVPASPTPSPLRVHVSGAVAEPDVVYRLPAGSIVQDALDAAGGATDDADLERVNLAQELEDQQHVHVPRVGEEDPPPAVSGGESGGMAGGLININTATQAELETLPGIGPAKAASIVSYREEHGPFQTVEDIQDVPGIGPATFDQLKDLIAVE